MRSEANTAELLADNLAGADRLEIELALMDGAHLADAAVHCDLQRQAFDRTQRVVVGQRDQHVFVASHVDRIDECQWFAKT